MKKIFTASLLVFISTFIFSQDLPHYMTPEEQKIWETYEHPVNSEFDYPPPVPVRVLAEWEEMDGVAITWTSYTSILRQIVDYAQDEGLVYIICSDSNTVKSYLTSGGVPLVNLKFIYAQIYLIQYGSGIMVHGLCIRIRLTV
jgi:agmatine deiminase